MKDFVSTLPPPPVSGFEISTWNLAYWLCQFSAFFLSPILEFMLTLFQSYGLCDTFWLSPFMEFWHEILLANFAQFVLIGKANFSTRSPPKLSTSSSMSNCGPGKWTNTSFVMKFWKMMYLGSLNYVLICGEIQRTQIHYFQNFQHIRGI